MIRPAFASGQVGLQISEDACRDLFVFQAGATPFKNNNIRIGFRYPDRTERKEFLVFLLSLDLLFRSGNGSFLIASPFQQPFKEISPDRILISTRYFSMYLYF